MALRKLFILLVILAILVLFTKWHNRELTKNIQDGPQSGDQLFPDLDINDIAAVDIMTPSATASLVRADGQWVVASLFNYPVKFSALAGALRQLGELEIGQVVHDGEQYLDELGLVEGGEDSDVPKIILVKDKDGRELSRCIAGSERERSGDGGFGSFGQGQYVRAGDGPPILVNDSLSAFNAEGKEWIEKVLLQVSSDDVVRVDVQSRENAYSINVKGGDHELVDLEEGKFLESGTVRRAAQALQYLQCVTVADPAITDENSGLGDPTYYTVTAKNGTAYKVAIGSQTENGNNRYIKLSVSYTAPPPPTREEVAQDIPEDEPAPEEESGTPGDETSPIPPKPSRENRIEETLKQRLADHEQQSSIDQAAVEELQTRLGPWTFVISNYTADSMTLPREKLVKQEEPEEGQEDDEET